MMIDWNQIKLFVEHTSAVDMDALHVVAGVLVLFAVSFVFRVPVSRWGPWLTVLALEILNEWNDLRVEQWPDLGMQYGESAKDILLTMLLPTLVLTVARLKPRLLVCLPTDSPVRSAPMVPTAGKVDLDAPTGQRE